MKAPGFAVFLWQVLQLLCLLVCSPVALAWRVLSRAWLRGIDKLVRALGGRKQFSPRRYRPGREWTWPKTVDQAVAVALHRLSPESKDALRAMPRAALGDLHFTLGLFIRNFYGIRTGDGSLRRDCMARDPRAFEPDGMSMVVIEAIWEALRRDGAAPAKPPG